MLANCLTAASPWLRKATHGCFHVFAWYRTKSRRHVLRRMLLKSKKKSSRTDYQVPTYRLKKWNTHFNEQSKVTIFTYIQSYHMSTSTLDQHAPHQLKVVQETTPHSRFASYKIKVSHAACKGEFRWNPRSHNWRFLHFKIIAAEKPYTTARILENEERVLSLPTAISCAWQPQYQYWHACSRWLPSLARSTGEGPE